MKAYFEEYMSITGEYSLRILERKRGFFLNKKEIKDKTIQQKVMYIDDKQQNTK